MFDTLLILLFKMQLTYPPRRRTHGKTQKLFIGEFAAKAKKTAKLCTLL